MKKWCQNYFTYYYSSVPMCKVQLFKLGNSNGEHSRNARLVMQHLRNANLAMKMANTREMRGTNVSKINQHTGIWMIVTDW